jgi:hypothetical protein
MKFINEKEERMIFSGRKMMMLFNPVFVMSDSGRNKAYGIRYGFLLRMVAQRKSCISCRKG